MKKLFLALASAVMLFASSAYGGERSRFYLIAGQVKECEIGQDGEPLAEVLTTTAVIPTEAKVLESTRTLIPVTSTRTVCENGVCRTISETSYVEANADQPATDKPAAVVWATPTGVPMATNSVCTSCNQSSATSRYAENSGPLPFVRETAQYLAARPKLFKGNFLKRFGSCCGR